ncbi:MAG: hypothetical protein Q8K75_04860 [Chlamydiales bacterium]|nr:hypothetical protein [Chlamydiales bacterium]
MQLFNDSHWSSLYMKNDYTQKSNRSKTHALHYLTVLSPNQAKSFIASNAATKDWVKSRMTKQDHDAHNFTPLMIAVIRQNGVLVNHYLDVCLKYNCLQQCLSQKDSKGWTVLHHATLSMPEIVGRLLDLKASEAPNLSDATYQDLQKLTTHGEAISTTNLSLETADGNTLNIRDMSREQIKESTGIEYVIDGTYYGSPEAIFDLWNDTKEHSLESIALHNHYADAVSQWRQNPPALTIKPSSELGNGQNGLFSNQDLDHAILGPYSGIWSPKARYFYDDPTDLGPDYTFSVSGGNGSIDAKAIGNGISRSNYGFPNAAITVQQIENGVNVQYLQTVQRVKANEEILWNYGTGYLRHALGVQKPLGHDRMRALFANGLDFVMSKIERAGPKTRLGLFEQISYAALNPSAFLELHFSGLVKVDQWMTLMGDSSRPTGLNPVRDTLQHDPFALRFLHIVWGEMDRLAGYMDNLPTTNRDMINQWIVSKIGVLSTVQIIKGINSLETMILQKSLRSIASVDSALQSLDASLPDFNWLTDDTFILRTNNVRREYMTLLQKHLPIEQLLKNALDVLKKAKPLGDQHINVIDAMECLRLLGMPEAKIQAAYSKF